MQQQQQKRHPRRGRKDTGSHLPTTVAIGRASLADVQNDHLHTAYTTPSAPGSFGGAHNLKRYADKTRRKTEHYLSQQDAYTLHKQHRKRFPRRKTLSKGIGDLCQADLVDLSNLSRYNDSHRYLLTCIDVFSKKAWVIPLLTKSSKHVTEAFEKILASARCRMLQTDKGSEFVNSTFQQMLQRHNVHFYTSENDDIKASVVERFNRTLKSKMYRYFTFKNTWRYVDVLQQLVDSYNATFHRSIGMSPNCVNAHNEELVRSRLYQPKSSKKPHWRYAVGDTVRIVATRHSPFAKGYTAKWTRELFKIVSRVPTTPATYTLSDLMDEPIKGKFYEPELQKVTLREHFTIYKILKTHRGADGKIAYYVSWQGYPSKFNSWIDEISTVADAERA